MKINMYLLRVFTQLEYVFYICMRNATFKRNETGKYEVCLFKKILMKTEKIKC